MRPTSKNLSRLLSLVLVYTSAVTAEQADTSRTLGEETPRSTRVPMELQGTQAPILAATINGTRARLRFDLGDSTALVLQKAVLEKTHATPTGQTARMQGIDGPFEASFFKIANFRIGSLEFPSAIAREDQTRKGYAASGEADGFLGTGLLKEFQIVIDYANRMMTLVPKAAADRTELCSGIEIPFSDNAKWRGEPVTEADTDFGRVILWWDTGAPASVLRKEIVQGKQSSDTLTSKRLRLGTRNFGPWPFQLWQGMNLPGFDGFLGHDFFARHVVCVDFPRARVVVSGAP